METEQDLYSLVEDLKKMLESNDSSLENTIPEQESKYQSPIKGTWYNSGGFTPSSQTPGHPNGHMGLDMRAPAGTPIFPLCNGIVSNVASDPKGGNTVSVQHPDGIRTYYAHMSTVSVHKGEQVSANTVLGTVGTSGNARSTFPHLHFQVWKNNQLQNPASFFSVPAYSKLNKNEQFWISEDAKQNAQAFNMNEHLSRNKTMASKKIDDIVKLASIYNELIFSKL